MDSNLKLLFDIANCREIELLPKELREKVIAVRDAEIRRTEKWSELEQKKAEAIKARTDELRNSLLCLGQWGEKVPSTRRFALCHRIGRRLVHWYNSEKPEYRNEPFYCAIDLVRGMMPVKWHYYNVGTEEQEIDFLYNRQLRPLFEAFDTGNEAMILKCLNFAWDRYAIPERERDVKFHVLKYHTEKGLGLDWILPIETGNKSDRVVIDEVGDYKTLAEHREDLKTEFCFINLNEGEI